MLLPIGSKVIMTCSLQGIAMHRKPVHGRHSRIEVEMGVEKGLRNRQKGGLPGEPRVVMALCTSFLALCGRLGEYIRFFFLLKVCR